MIYLDNSATSQMLPCVKKAMKQSFDTNFGNASSLHSAGQRAKNQIEFARQQIAKTINASPEEIIFTSGGSESNNTIINIFKNQNIVVSAIEHPSIIEPTKKYAKTYTLLPADDNGKINLNIYQETLNSKKNFSLISVMLANNELGTIEPIKQLVQQKPKNTYFHSDLTQALGKIKIDVKDLNLDYATISSHKIGGPIGIGALYIKNGTPFTPLILGGHQESGKRAGTYPTHQIIGFGEAARYLNDNQTWKIYNKRVRKFRNLLAQKILENIPFSSLNTDLENSLPNILNVSFAAAEGESIQLYLDLKKEIIVSTGSACASGEGKPSHVIMATKGNAEIAHSSIRFSLNEKTAKKDIDEVIKVLPSIIKNLQEISTIKSKEQDA